jgi:hypothetical protein
LIDIGKKEKPMEGIDSILQKLEALEANMNVKNINYIRKEIADLIIERLKSVKDSLGYWEKLHFAYAIATLKTSWLRLCLVTLEKAFIPAGERDEYYIPRDNQIDSLTYEQLMEEIESIRMRF